MTLATTAPISIPTPPRRRLSSWQLWGLIFVAPYVAIFVLFVAYPVGYGLWLARDPQSYTDLANDPIFFRSVINTVLFVLLAVVIKMTAALFLSSFFATGRTWIRWLSVLFILPWAVPSIPTILSFRFMVNPEWGIINQLIFKLTLQDGPNWLSDPTLAFSLAILVHVWKSLPFWTLILLASRLAVPGDLYEAASVDGATTWQKFRFITWPSMATAFLTCALLSMIWALGDFNSVYLMTGGGPADRTHVLATMGVRFLRLDRVDLAMATVVCSMPLVLPLVFIMMKRFSK